MSIRELKQLLFVPNLMHENAQQVTDEERFLKIDEVIETFTSNGSVDFEGLLAALPQATSGELSAALVELEVFGAVVHKGGRRYEKH